MGKMKESHLTRSMISLRVKKEIEDEFIWEIQMILYNLLVYKTNKKRWNTKHEFHDGFFAKR